METTKTRAPTKGPPTPKKEEPPFKKGKRFKVVREWGGPYYIPDAVIPDHWKVIGRRDRMYLIVGDVGTIDSIVEGGFLAKLKSTEALHRLHYFTWEIATACTEPLDDTPGKA